MLMGDAQMKSLTPKEAREQFEFLMAMEKLLRVLNQPRKAKRPKRAQKAAAARLASYSG